ncbi:MAG: hypothetical protein NT096_10770 [Proteobacteria bacterium]|nr:hypothetical protein [Pseudomonadota bacterium]
MMRSSVKILAFIGALAFLASMILSLRAEACGCCAGGGPKGQGYGASGNGGAGAGGRPCCQLAYNQKKDSRVSNQGQSPSALSQEIEKDAREKALKLYQDTYGKKDSLIAKVTDYGCHIQVDVYDGDKVVKSYTYQQGNVFEM